MNIKEIDFDKWFHNFCEERNFNRIFVSDKDFAPLICGIAQVEAFENRYINSAFSSFLSCKTALEKAEFDDPLSFELWINEDYSKVIVIFFDDVGYLDKIKIYPDLKSNTFKCYRQTNCNEEEYINFIEDHIDRDISLEKQ